MADGIRINDAALEISPEGVATLARGGGAEFTVSRLDLTVSQEALNTLLAGMAPEGGTAPSVELADGQLRLTGEREEKKLTVDLRMNGLKLEIAADGLRLVSE